MFSLVYRSVRPPNSYNSLQHYHIYSTYVRTVPPVPITHFSITTYAYVHVEATYKSSPPTTSNSLQHMHIYSTAGPNPDTEQQQPQIKKTAFKSHVSYATYLQTRRTFQETSGITTLHQSWGPKTRSKLTSTTGPPGPHWPI